MAKFKREIPFDKSIYSIGGISFYHKGKIVAVAITDYPIKRIVFTDSKPYRKKLKKVI